MTQWCLTTDNMEEPVKCDQLVVHLSFTVCEAGTWAAVCHHHVLLKGSGTEQLNSWKLDWSQFRPWLDPACCAKLFKTKPEKAAKRTVAVTLPARLCFAFCSLPLLLHLIFFRALLQCQFVLYQASVVFDNRDTVFFIDGLHELCFVSFQKRRQAYPPRLYIRRLFQMSSPWGRVHECVWCLCCISCGRCLRRSVGMTWAQADAPSDSPE